VDPEIRIDENAEVLAASHTDKQRKVRFQWTRSKQQLGIYKWVHVVFSRCFAHIVIVLLKELGGFKMKDLVLFALRRSFNMVPKFMSGDDF